MSGNLTAATAPVSPSVTVLFNVRDCIFLALDILDSPSPFPEEACELLREALAEIRTLLKGVGQ